MAFQQTPRNHPDIGRIPGGHPGGHPIGWFLGVCWKAIGPFLGYSANVSCQHVYSLLFESVSVILHSKVQFLPTVFLGTRSRREQR